MLNHGIKKEIYSRLLKQLGYSEKSTAKIVQVQAKWESDDESYDNSDASYYESYASYKNEVGWSGDEDEFSYCDVDEYGDPIIDY